MPSSHLNRAEFDAFINQIIRTREKNKTEKAKIKEENKRLKRCEEFLRGLLRTHTHLPAKGDMRPQVFFQDIEGNPVLVREFLVPETETTLLKMKTIAAKETRMIKMKNGNTGFLLFVCPFNDFKAPHFRIVVDFNTMTSEDYKK